MKFYELGHSFFRKMVQIRSNFMTTCTIRGTRGAKLPADATFSESLEKSLDKVVSRGEKNFSVHRKYMNFFQYRKTALDEHLYKLSAGRSMVEMLGVLAIIGVLSVGAISGYSKAMMKYKLNRQAQQISELINNIHQYQYQFRFTTTNRMSLLPYFKKLNLIPDGMHIINTNSGSGIGEFLKDSFGTYSSISISESPYNDHTILGIGGKTNYESTITFPSLDVGITYCKNIILSLQPIFRDNPKHFCLIYLRSKVGGGQLINLTEAKYDFANMSESQIRDICLQQLELTDNNQVFYQICFDNSY